MRNQQNVKVRVNSSFETICPFPIGYVYMSSNSTSPGSIYGGTWASLQENRYLRLSNGFGTGGNNSIQSSNLPPHQHQIYFRRRAATSGTGYMYSMQTSSTDPDGVSSDFMMENVVIGDTVQSWLPYYPSFRNVYAWYRTA